VKEPAVFLDRDGTLIEEMGYPTRPEQIRILGGVGGALRRLADAGYRLVVVTNQSAIARGLLTEDDLNRFHQALDEQLDLLGARVDAYYACPHHPDPTEAKRPELAMECDCRKPKPGLLIQAAEDLGLDLSQSWMVGDMWRDIGAGRAAGVRTIKLPALPGHEAERPAEIEPPTAEAPGLDGAADFILHHRLAGAEEIEAEAPQPETPEVEAAEPAPVVEEPLPAPVEEPPPPSPAEEPVDESPPPEPAPVYVEEPEAEPELPPVAEEPDSEIIAAETAPAPTQTAPVAPPAAPPPPNRRPALSARTCARCAQPVPDSDIASGAAARRDGLLLCGECLPRRPAAAEERLPDNTPDLLRQILLELRRAGRSRQSPGFSFLRLMAYLAQAGAIFCGLVLVLVGADKTFYLQIAILLQLLVITLLLLERNS
jgi:D-glycero-D-manno-heptose 1,7-bisphosphate phosphatase